MKFLTSAIIFGVLITNGYSRELNQRSIFAHLDNLIESEENSFNRDIKTEKFKLFPMYWRGFEKQKKFDPAANYLLNNFDLVRKDRELKRKFEKLIQGNNFHFALYLFSKGVESKKVELNKLKWFYPTGISLINNAARYFEDPNSRERELKPLSFRDFFLIHNYTMAPGSHFIDKYRYKDITWRQHLNYNELNKTTPSSGSDRWLAKVDTVNAMKKLKPFQGKVWSGQRTPIDLDRKLRDGDTLCFGGFLSTSKDEFTGNHYRKKVKSKYLFQIESKTGVSIKSFSKFKKEEEILFYPYKKFKLVKITSVADDDPANLRPPSFSDSFMDTNKKGVKMVHLKEIKDHKGPCKSMTTGERWNPKQYFGK